LLVGRRVPIAELARDADELHRILAGARVRLHKNGSLAEEGAGANVLDSPLQALQHFLVELRACPGATDVASGDIVTTGTWTDAWPVRAGETWTARFDSPLPALQVAFA
jgi:2-oxo-3-hexenedioate decarboxylase